VYYTLLHSGNLTCVIGCNTKLAIEPIKYEAELGESTMGMGEEREKEYSQESETIMDDHLQISIAMLFTSLVSNIK